MTQHVPLLYNDVSNDKFPPSQTSVPPPMSTHSPPPPFIIVMLNPSMTWKWAFPAFIDTPSSRTPFGIVAGPAPPSCQLNVLSPPIGVTVLPYFQVIGRFPACVMPGVQETRAVMSDELEEQ